MLLQSRQFCPLAVNSLQSLLSEPLLIANMSVERAIAGSKHAGSPQTCQAASKPRSLPALSAALRSKDYARKCSERAWDCGGFCNLWLQTAPHEAVQFQGLCECSVSSLQSLLSEPLLIANMSVERAIAGSKHAGSPQTCQAASKPRPLPALSAALRSKDYAKKCSELAWDCGGFCNLWLQNAPHEAVQFQGLCECSVSSLQSLLSEP